MTNAKPLSESPEIRQESHIKKYAEMKEEIRTYRGEGYYLQTGIDALSFIQNIPDSIFEQIDCIIWDPPYMDPSDPNHVERLNSRRRRFNETSSLRFLERKYRDKVLDIIKQKMNPDGYILQFHTIKEELLEGGNCIHGWIKTGPAVFSGSSCPNNIEWINIIGPKIPRTVGRVLNKYIIHSSEYTYNGGFPRLVRGCAKPLTLYLDLLKHVSVSFVLDPFAGYGRSISAALNLGIDIYACDIDSSLDWHDRIPSDLDSFFNGGDD